MSLQITKKIEFDTAHRLGRGYKSKCRNLHGHRYSVHITCTCQQMDNYSMVVDFGKIKQICKGWIDEYIDHGTIVDERDEELINFLNAADNKFYVVPFLTTVENITPWLRDTLQEQIDNDSELKTREVRITHLRLYETPNGWCDVTEDSTTMGGDGSRE